MKGNAGKIAVQSIGDVAILFCAFSLLFPASASVLCIAPGHVAIEELNAACCSLSKIPARTDYHRGNGFNVADSCRNCTDLLISINERGGISKSHQDSGTGSLICDRCGDSIPANASSGLLHRNALDVPEASPPSSPVLPLRC